MRRLSTSWMILGLLILAAAGALAATPDGPPPFRVSLHAGPVFSQADLAYDPAGPTHDLRTLEFDHRMGWRVRVDVTQFVSELVAFQAGLGFARERFLVQEEGFFPDPDGEDDPAFAEHETEFAMLRMDVPLKLVLRMPLPGDAGHTDPGDGLMFTMGPRLGFNLFGDEDYADPQWPGLAPMRSPVAFEFGAAVTLAGPGKNRLLLAVDYAIDLADRLGSEHRDGAVDDAPYGTWRNLRLRTLGVSVGLQF